MNSTFYHYDYRSQFGIHVPFITCTPNLTVKIIPLNLTAHYPTAKSSLAASGNGVHMRRGAQYTSHTEAAAENTQQTGSSDPSQAQAQQARSKHHAKAAKAVGKRKKQRQAEMRAKQ